MVEIADDESRNSMSHVPRRLHGVQMLEIHPQSCHSRHFTGSSGWLAGENARSVTRCNIMRSDMTRTRPGHPKTSGYGCTESATSASADYPLITHTTMLASLAPA